MFEIGEKVICINNKAWKPTWDPPNGIEEGVVYTIRGFDVNPFHNMQVVFLNETQNPGYETSSGELTDLGYLVHRFRKLIKKKQSIEIFNQIRKNVEDNAHIYSVIPQDELEKYLS